ncbi:type II toxin-antitoxin system VapB family antitoxin [Chromohalobacter canadensis]|uniref:Type II toxin-antitoxin system VapB family antitoxin n=1 Tax=Chromohalobacter canadensis TaxID=141389 RepID=A0ABZ0YA47_9GAMM|nr:type II toxin-antitoxin system VapB family antitoxin [Chromohalobacter canadensis]MCK0770348.1 antitoxin [Chromohalobacter canadensis]WQH08940.1 type II toxin-antitoxin system VapB family antitoxin [Chromohalobacter canadensis]WQH08945.1 type II toxin-antitoxin system VapB family antitoxin [Chromohalobacter canadensis]
MPQGSVFQSNRNQAIRLPKASAFPEGVKRVEIISIGRTRIIVPAGESWDSWFDEPGATADFMSTREQPEDQRREAF